MDVSVKNLLEIGLALLPGIISVILAKIITNKLIRIAGRKAWLAGFSHLLLAIQNYVLVLVFLFFCSIALYPFIADTPYTRHYEITANVIMTVLLAILASKLIRETRFYLTRKYMIEKLDNLKERRMLTQFAYIEKALYLVVIVIALSAILMNFENVKKLGMSLLASAGVITAILVFAGQKTLSGLWAGLQIAFSQPIKVDDIVIIKDQFGRIEEITLSYVVIRLWDKRRMIVPVNYFLENIFENWTYKTSDLIGAIFIYSDYTLDVEAVRQQLDRILTANKKWDGQVKSLQVSDAKTDTIELRILVSAINSSQLWDLRCEVREELIRFIQRKFPQSLPKNRVELIEVNEKATA